jgi:hypothetical protein
MEDNRNHDHYVFQDLDLLGNEIKNVRKVSSDDDLTLAAGSNNDVIVNSETHIKGNVLIQGTDANNNPAPKTLTVSGTSLLKDNVVIGTSNTDTTHDLTVAGVRIFWDDTSGSLVFMKNTSNS